MKKKGKLLSLVLLALLGGGAGYSLLKPQEAQYVYRTQPVTRGSITSTISATGKVNAVEMVEVGTQVSGTIKEIYVDYNSAVRKGQILALLDPDVLRSKVDESRASLALTKAGVARAKADVADAERSNKRNKELWGRDLIAKSEMETAETQLLVAKAALAEANAKVVQAQASLNQSETNLSYTKIYSPIDGVVVDRQVDVGQTVAASLQTPTLFSIARDLTQMQIEAAIDEADIGRIQDGQTAHCKFDSWPEEIFDATVTQKRLNPETVSNVVTYTVILKVDNTDRKLMPGMTANLSVVIEQRDDIVKIPAAALRFTPPSEVATALAPDSSGQASSRSGLLAIPQRPQGNGTQDEKKGRTVWLVDNGRLTGNLVLEDLGASDRTWVEVRGDAAAALKEGQQLAVSFGKAEPGSASAGTRQ